MLRSAAATAPPPTSCGMLYFFSRHHRLDLIILGPSGTCPGAGAQEVLREVWYEQAVIGGLVKRKAVGVGQ
jgi:hypothetical protein